MRHGDIQRLHEAGLITGEQRQRIIDHFGLKENSNRFLMILSVAGGLLVSLGLILLVASNWDSIPRALKLATGVALLIGTHAAGYACREGAGNRPRTAEALHFAGALLFLGNIALVGQIYHLESRAPDAWLLWWLGIAGLPWVLRSRPLHLLALVSFLVWFGAECWSSGGWFHFGGQGFPTLLFVLVGLAWYGAGRWLHTTRWRLFAHDTEKAGLGLALLFSIPLSSHLVLREVFGPFGDGSTLPFWILAGIAIAALTAGLRSDPRLTGQWRVAWGAALGALLLLLATVTLCGGLVPEILDRSTLARALGGLGALVLFAFALIQVRVGVLVGSEWMVNQAILLLAAVVVSTYLGLIGSMADTGAFFVVSGILLIGFAAFLERRRRAWLRAVRQRPTAVAP